MTSPWRRRWRFMLVAAVLLGATMAAWPGGAQPASGSVAAGTRLWVSRYNGSGAGAQATAIAPNLGGTAVFVTGLSRTGPATQSWVTIAYNAKTGKRLWLTAHAEGNGTGTAPRAISVSTDGTKVFVTGAAPGAPHRFMTIAYDAVTGKQLWISTSSIAATPAAMVAFGTTVVYVTGSTAAANGVSPDYVTIAYKAATGAQLWISRYNGPANRGDFGQAIAVNPGQRVAYVTGGSQDVTGSDMVTIAYSVSTGAQLWAQRYDAGGNSSNQGLSLAVFDTGAPLIVTGRIVTVAGRRSDVTINYNERTGKPVWIRHFKPLNNFSFNPVAMAIGPLAAIAYVAGDTGLPSHEEGYGTVAFTLNGSVVWRGHYAGPADGKSFLLGLAIGPQTGGTLYETGASDSSAGVPDFATLAYVAR